MDAAAYGQLSVDQVLAALDAGDLTLDEVQTLERETGKDRKTILRLADQPSTPTEPEEPAIVRPSRSRAFSIDPKLVEERERQRQRLVRRVQPRKATIDPKLIAQREATKAKEASLRGRSLRESPRWGR